jgi:hypothetical protein
MHTAVEHRRRLISRVSLLGAAPARTALTANRLLSGGPDEKEAGSPSENPEILPAYRVERETGFEPATLSLGS